MKFNSEEVATRFECLAQADVIKHTSAFHGPLSNIDVKTAEFLVATGDQHIKEKKASPAATPATKAEDKK